MADSERGWLVWGELALVCGVIAVGFPVSVMLPLLVLASVALWARKRSWIEVGFDITDDFVHLAMMGLVLGAAAQLFNVAVLKPELESLTGRAVELNHMPPLRGNASVLVNAVILTWGFVVATEMVFRGYLIDRVAALVKDKGVAHGVGVVVSAGLYAWAVGGGRLEGVVGAFIAGVGYGYLYLAAGRQLVLPIAFAAAFETVGLVAIYLKMID